VSQFEKSNQPVNSLFAVAELTAEPLRPKLKSWLDYTAGEN
jgi:cell pole-organizing protein PopZ